MNFKRRIKILDSVFLTELEDEMVVLNSETGEYFTLNDSGAFFFQQLAKTGNFTVSVHAVTQHFEVEPEVVEADAQELVRALLDEGLIEFES